MKLITRNFGDAFRYFGAEDGRHYRGIWQGHAALKAHIRFLNDKVNGAPASGNRNRWGYAGSIPMSLLTAWLWRTRTPMDVWARNEGGAKDQFKLWLRREHPHLLPKPGAAARPQIVVPLTYRKRNDG
jgi:hypothetical protein